MNGTPLVYLSGPMTGYPDFNFPAFEDAARRLREAGYAVISPAEHDLDGGFDPSDPAAPFDLRAALEWDVAAVERSDMVVVLPGWEDSPGCAIEVITAKANGKRVITLDEALGPPVAA